MNILMGADPELFCFKDGKPTSAYNLIKGDKKNPQPVDNGAVQVDGMALEFNINPASNEQEFLFNIKDVMQQLKAMVPEYDVQAVPIAFFGEEYIKNQPKEAKILGCDPDYNAWTSKENQPPNAELPFRTAAGHIHIGWTDKADAKDVEHLGMVESLVKQLDFFLGLPSILFDTDKQRRGMYGKAGAYRSKEYGCEYRVLSNKWLTNDNLIKLIYNNTQKGIDRLMKGEFLSKVYGDIQDVINKNDVDSAIEIMQTEGIQYEVR